VSNAPGKPVSFSRPKVGYFSNRPRMSICMCDIPFDRSILQLSNSIRHVMPSTDRKLELTAKASMAQPVSQPAVCSSGLKSISVL
jgi:hypothetical protein